MSQAKFRRPLLASAVITAIAVAAGCGEESDPVVVVDNPTLTPPPVAMASYSGPGSNWNVDLNDDGSYAISRSEMPGAPADLAVSGQYSYTAEGFLSLTIDASSGDDAVVRGNTSWALEIPNYSLTLSPVSTVDDRAVTMVGGGVCPSSDINANWIAIASSLSSDAQSEAGSYFGSLDYSYAQGSTWLRSQHALTGGNPDQGQYSLGNGFCRSGIISSPSSDIYLSMSGATTVHVDAASPDGGTFVLALPRTTLGSIDDFDGNYAGVVTDEGALVGQKIRPVVVSCTSGICSGDFVSDVESGALAGTPFTVDLSGSINAPGPGLTTGTVDIGGITGNIGCMADPATEYSGQRVISCAGQSIENGYALLNLILASND